jgi:hypothetical protein
VESTLKMTSREFAYWLQGFFELQADTTLTLTLTNKQVEIIKAHLNMVFIHEIDPSYPDEVQDALNAAHSDMATSSAIPVVPYYTTEPISRQPTLPSSNFPAHTIPQRPTNFLRC